MKNKEIHTYELPNNVLETVPDPMVSVRTLAYNHAPYIRDCIESVLMQETSFSFEFIIAEDNSTDGTREIVFEYAGKYPGLIRVITGDENVGGLANLYRGNAKTRGKYIAVCEGDDYWTDPKKLEKQVALMEANEDCDLSFHPVLVEWRRHSKKEVYKRHANHDYLFPVERIIVEGGEFCPTASLMIRKKAMKVLEDWFMELPVGDYFAQVAASLNGGAMYIDEVMAVYRKGVPGSWSENHKSFRKMCEHSLNMVKAYRTFNRKTDYKYHTHFSKRETIVLKKYSLFKLWQYDNQTVREVLLLIRQKTSGSLKVKCYLYVVLSFAYYRLKIRELFKIKSKLMS